MRIDAIKNGIVIDHITSGRGMKLYELLGLAARDDVSVAIIMHVVSCKMGKKDIIKIDADIPVNLDIIGYVDPGATVNFIRDGVLVDKKNIEPPKVLRGVLRCRNPRCITSTEQELEQVFRLTDEKNKVYRCAYCEVAEK